MSISVASLGELRVPLPPGRLTCMYSLSIGDSQNADCIPDPLQHRARISNHPYCCENGLPARRVSIPETLSALVPGRGGGLSRSIRRCSTPSSITKFAAYAGSASPRYRGIHLSVFSLGLSNSSSNVSFHPGFSTFVAADAKALVDAATITAARDITINRIAATRSTSYSPTPSPLALSPPVFRTKGSVGPVATPLSLPL